MALPSTDRSGTLTGPLPEGVRLRRLQTHVDDRGSLTEVFRANWDTGIAPVQWNVTTSKPGTLRGVHVHRTHDDYLVLLTGRASIGIRDLRTGSATEGRSALVELSGSELRTLTIPPGVAHGFYFQEESMMLYSVSHYWSLDDEFGCRWDDPDLEIPWPTTSAMISVRDAGAASLRELLHELEPWQPLGSPPPAARR
jgi:dTDP-4-dehydrorhamnose 3,5-epimerase